MYKQYDNIINATLTKMKYDNYLDFEDKGDGYIWTLLPIWGMLSIYDDAILIWYYDIPAINWKR